MSQEIPKNEWTSGAGKGDHERPLDRRVFRDNLSKIKKNGMRGKVAAVKGIKTTYKYEDR
jgi:hypothetical protein